MEFTKDYLKEKFGKEKAQDYYTEFGIIIYGFRYILLNYQINRRKAPEVLLAALVKYGFDTRTYGTGFWRPPYVA